MQHPLTENARVQNASSLLATLNEIYLHGIEKNVGLDSSTAICLEKAVPDQLMDSIWRHSFKQSEDELLLLFPGHESSDSLMFSAVNSFPGVDSRVLPAWTVLQPFLTAMTPQNLNYRMHNGISFAISLNGNGEVVSSRVHLAAKPLFSLDPLLNLDRSPGNRAFDVFYHFFYSQIDDSLWKELLALKPSLSEYDLLKKSETYTLPEWVNFADDYTLAKDWADSLTEVFPKKFRRSLLLTLSGILLLGNNNPQDIAEGAALCGLDSEEAGKYSPSELIEIVYNALLFSVEGMINEYLATLDMPSNGTDAIFSVVTIAELSSIPEHKYYMLKGIFDNNYSLNGEMENDGLELPKTPSNVQKAITTLQGSKEGSKVPPANVKALLHSSATWYRDDNYSDELDLDQAILSARLWTILALAVTDQNPSELSGPQWSSNLVSSQIRDLFITEWIARSKQVNYTTDYDTVDFANYFAGILPPDIPTTEIASWASERFTASQFFQGHNRIYLNEGTWIELETQKVHSEMGFPTQSQHFSMIQPPMPFQQMNPAAMSMGHLSTYEPSIQLPPPKSATQVPGQVSKALEDFNPEYEEDRLLNGDSEDETEDQNGAEDAELLNDFKGVEEPGQHIEVRHQTKTRKSWVIFVWLCTFWIPSPLLNWFGGMKRRDVRLAWREKVTIFFLITLFNAGIIFYMIVLGRLICPEFDKVWNHKELSYHQGTNDFYVAIHGNVYDITKFYTIQHSDNGVRTSSSVMLPFAGSDLSDYFPPPLTVACPSLVSDDSFALLYNLTRNPYTEALHTSGPVLQPHNYTALHEMTWYEKVFKPKILQYYKGTVVETEKDIQKLVSSDPSRYIVIINKVIYDMSNYIRTINQYPSNLSPQFQKYSFFPDAVTNMFINYQGSDITDKWMSLDEKTRTNALECMNNAFVYGYSDFRHTAKCQAANIILLVLAGLLTSITVIKFLAAIRFGSKPMPSAQDKFVLCQVPVYTEGEDDVRLALDSLTNMDYDNRRKLLVILCDGMITGAGNDRPTPQIILDLLGVDESRINPEAKAYHAIAEGAKELNYAKVYSGLYENEGNMVPYICVVKCGVPGEYRPGNRGKRDSQLLLMNFLNRVHYGDPMCPLDLELFHHINNIIGIEPERFEYLLTIDADTTVKPDALNRMVAACTADNSISAVCGETGIENEKQSLSTMIQVYEYFISHHLTKAFESLFGSVTCLPGCFSLFRLRTVQRYKPLLISSEVIREYSLRHVDTLHKKNLFSLGEDRYLTTLMSKNFYRMKMKFVADAKCLTRVPDDFSVLLSQRRRWINSTVHNLAELLQLPNMCGFFLFSMRGIVFTDLIGTLMLPSVVIYLVYLIYVLASHSAPLPLISIVLIASVYGLQALVFIMHQQWQHIFWMIVYIAAYPFHSFILPIYSFWNMDNFSWGNTRIVLEEKRGRKVILQDDGDVYDPKKVPFETWHSYATRMGLPGRERPIVYDSRKGRIERDIFEDPSSYARYQDNEVISVAPLHSDASEFPRPPSAIGSIAGFSTLDGGPFDAGTEAQIRDTIQQVLNSSDLDAMTSRQLRAKVSDLLGTDFTGERAAYVDYMIDQELEKMDDMAEFDVEDPENIA